MLTNNALFALGRVTMAQYIPLGLNIFSYCYNFRLDRIAGIGLKRHPKYYEIRT